MKKKHIYLISFLAVLLLSCDKFKQNLPTTIGFNLKVEKSTFMNGFQFTSSFLNAEGFEVKGTREKAEAVEIKKSFESSLITFSESTSLYFSMECPVGKYNSFKVAMNMTSTSSPTAGIKGTALHQDTLRPVLIEWNGISSFDFDLLSNEKFELKKDKTAQVFLHIDIQKIFSNVTPEMFSNASLISVNGDDTILINAENNLELYGLISAKLQEALYLTLIP